MSGLLRWTMLESGLEGGIGMVAKVLFHLIHEMLIALFRPCGVVAVFLIDLIGNETHKGDGGMGDEGAGQGRFFGQGREGGPVALYQGADFFPVLRMII